MTGLRVLSPHRDELGEGPHWDAAAGRLRWVDLHRGVVRSSDADGGAPDALELGEPVTFVIPAASGGFVVGRHHDVEHVDASGGRRLLARVDPDEDDLRLNDAKCDAAGRLVFGTMSMTRRIGFSSLYTLAPDGTLGVLSRGVSLSNGIGWDPSGHLLYHVDSDAQAVLRYSYDPVTGAATDRSELARIDPAEGLPDGLAVDAEGGVWVAMMFAGHLRRYTADGTLSARVDLPVRCPASVAFGGADLRTLYVTTAAWMLDDPAGDPTLAGAVFAFEPGVAGAPVGTFGG